MAKLEQGTRVTVATERGEELGTVVGGSNPAAGEAVVYDVRFDDDTYSSWSEQRVTTPGAECQHCAGQVVWGSTEHGCAGFVHAATGRAECPTS